MAEKADKDSFGGLVKFLNRGSMALLLGAAVAGLAGAPTGALCLLVGALFLRHLIMEAGVAQAASAVSGIVAELSGSFDRLTGALREVPRSNPAPLGETDLP